MAESVNLSFRALQFIIQSHAGEELWEKLGEPIYEPMLAFVESPLTVKNRHLHEHFTNDFSLHIYRTLQLKKMNVFEIPIQ